MNLLPYVENKASPCFLLCYTNRTMDDFDPYAPYLPSRRLAGILILSVAVLAGFYFYEKTRPLVYQGSKKEIAIKEPTATIRDITSRDSDGDGVNDWEEALWGTDPNRLISNTDGLSDNDYINKKKLAVQQKNKTGTTKQLTKTEELARDIFITTVSLEQSGNYSPEAAQAMSKKIADKIRNAPTKDHFTENNLRIAKEESPGTLATYGAAWIIVRKKYEPYRLGSEMYLVAEVLNNNAPANLKKLKTYGALYKAFANDVMLITVPPSLAISQLQVSNDLYALSEALDNVNKLYSDSITGLIGINQYKNRTSDLIVHLQKIENFYRQLAAK